MNKSKLQPYADLKVKTRSYIDNDNVERGAWLQIGTLFSTPHGSHMTIKIDSLPVIGSWDGWISVFKRDSAAQEIKDIDEPTPAPVIDELTAKNVKKIFF